MNSYQFGRDVEDYKDMSKTFTHELNQLLLWQDEVIVAVEEELIPDLIEYCSVFNLDWHRIYFYSLSGNYPPKTEPLIFMKEFTPPQIVIASSETIANLTKGYHQVSAWFSIDF